LITDIIVVLSLALSAAFVVAWKLWPGLRTWIERPKHRFHDSLQRYDRATHLPVATKEAPLP